jgi:hypothetical protein
VKPARYLFIAPLLLLAIVSFVSAEEQSPPPASTEEKSTEAGEDSSAGLPDAYAKNYLVAASTLSPNKKFAVIYPKMDSEEFPEGKDYLVALQPFAILGALETKYPYFQNESHGGLSAEWSDDSSVALITLESKWGPGDIFLAELRDGKLSRMTTLLAKLHELLLPDYAKTKPKPEPYNDEFDFVFEEESEPTCQLDGTTAVKVNAEATTDPKGIAKHAWAGRVKAVWDISAAKFTEQKVTREPHDAPKESD